MLMCVDRVIFAWWYLVTDFCLQSGKNYGLSDILVGTAKARFVDFLSFKYFFRWLFSSRSNFLFSFYIKKRVLHSNLQSQTNFLFRLIYGSFRIFQYFSRVVFVFFKWLCCCYCFRLDQLNQKLNDLALSQLKTAERFYGANRTKLMITQNNKDCFWKSQCVYVWCNSRRFCWNWCFYFLSVRKYDENVFLFSFSIKSFTDFRSCRLISG